MKGGRVSVKLKRGREKKTENMSVLTTDAYAGTKGTITPKLPKLQPFTTQDVNIPSHQNSNIVIKMSNRTFRLKYYTLTHQ